MRCAPSFETSPLVEQVYYESSDEAFNRFQQQFKNSPILENVTPAALPESFRVKPLQPGGLRVARVHHQRVEGR